LHTVCLRYFNVFGPRQDPHSQYSAVIPKMIRMILNGERPVIFGDGEQTRDFTYIENVVQANVLAATSDCPPGTIVNCACHERTTLNEVINGIARILGESIAPEYREARSGDVKHSFASIEKAKSLLAYSVVCDFKEGLSKTVESFKAHGAW
jgi:nucleoside-diphosphate-sugar epimerase